MEGHAHFSAKHFDDIDAACEANNYFLPVLEEAARFVNFRTAQVLDVGCGTGVFMAPILSWGCAGLYGVDGPTTVASRAIARGYRDVRVVGDLNTDRLPFDDQRFDFVVCKDVFEHLLAPEFALDEIRRVLRDRGVLLLHVPNHFPLYARLKFVLTNDIDTCRFFPGSSRWSFPHVRFFEHKDFTATVDRHGFQLMSDFSWNFPVVPFFDGSKVFRPLVKALVSRFPGQLAGGFSLLLRKRGAGMETSA